MHVKAVPMGQPGRDLGVLFNAAVVDDQVVVQVFRDGLLDLSLESKTFLVAMTSLH